MILKNKEYVYNGVLGNYIRDYVRMKQSFGCKFRTEAGILRRFDRYCTAQNLFAPILTKEFMRLWAEPRSNEMVRTRRSRCTAVSGFIKYLNSIGMEAALPPKIPIKAADKTFVPYIYTHEQISNIIANADMMPQPKRGSMFHIVFPVILRVLYGCGLRISEALALKKEDVNLTSGMITIYRSKNMNSRQTPISLSLKSALNEYSGKMDSRIVPGGYFFPNAKGEQYSQRTTYDKFREILWLSGISHKGRGGPRLHDIRHTFCVHSLSRWVQDGRDGYVLLPVLATYLGHQNIACTEQYLRLTAEMFPSVLEQTKTISDVVIPEVSDYETY